MMPFKKNLPAAGSGFSDYYVPEEKFLGPPSPKNLATPLLQMQQQMLRKCLNFQNFEA